MLGYTFCQKLRQETHVIIGGSAGSGKSTLLNDFLYTLTSYNPQCERMILIDLKRVELVDWIEFPHVLDVITEPEDVLNCLDRVINMMEYRYKEMRKRHQKQSDKTHVHLIVDEAAEVFRIKGALDRIDKLMRLSRAANIHIVLATQQVNRTHGIPGYIYQNASCKIGLRCDSAIESRMIIGIKGCESLPRYGEAIIKNAEEIYIQEVPLTTDEMIRERLEHYKKTA